MLVELGWQVIAIGRDPLRIARASIEIGEAVPGAKISFLRADFDSMHEVARVARDIADITQRVDVLINNAGGVRDKRYSTPDGFEATFAANHLAPFLLTRELMPQLKRAVEISGPGAVRVIAVSSSGHAGCPAMNWDDLNLNSHFTTGGAYCQAKLANLLFTRELTRRVAEEGIVAQTMHPGRVASNFASYGDPQLRRHMEAASTIHPDEAARTLVWLATDAEGGRAAGRYFHELQEVTPAPQALDDDAARKLWTASERLLESIGL